MEQVGPSTVATAAAPGGWDESGPRLNAGRLGLNANFVELTTADGELRSPAVLRCGSQRENFWGLADLSETAVATLRVQSSYHAGGNEMPCALMSGSFGRRDRED